MDPGETVYGDTSALSSSSLSPSHVPGSNASLNSSLGYIGGSGELGEGSGMSSCEEVQIVSERVTTIANSIYREFESMIETYGQDVVKRMMPLVVGILESMDQLYRDKHELDTELELIREDNVQLMSQYERERTSRKSAEEKILKVEDTFEEEKNEMIGKMESLESITRLLELKAKNANDHVSRLEEKEIEMKKEFQKLHERYTELFRNHVDYLERAKSVHSGNHQDSATRLLVAGESSRPVVVLRSTGRPLVEPPVGVQMRDVQQPEDPALPVTDKRRIMSHIIDSTPELQPPSANSESDAGSSNPDAQYGAIGGDLGFDEMTMPDADAGSDEGEPPVIDDRDDVDSEFGMSREIENLIKENVELIETKNALNIVKDDLITKVDDLSGENEMLREEVASLQMMKTNMREKISGVEQELKEVKLQLDQVKNKKHDEEDDEVPLSQRKRFTRIEMARILMERNNYKERYMELQEAVRYTEMMRASKEHPDALPNKKKNSVWNIFSNLFTPGGKKSRSGSTSVPPRASRANIGGSPSGAVRYSIGDQAVTTEESAVKQWGVNNRIIDESRGVLSDDTQGRTSRTSSRRDKFPTSGSRIQAYGWSLPAKTQLPLQAAIPVPVYCRPIVEKQPGMKLWCAAGVNLSGTRNRSGDNIVGTSVFYKCAPSPSTSASSETGEVAKLDKQLQVEMGMSSLVWICTTANDHSQIIVIDANHPADFVDSFYITESHALCIGSVPGATECDYDDSSQDFVVTSEGSSPEQKDEGSSSEGVHYRVHWVECSLVEPKEVRTKTTSEATGNFRLLTAEDFELMQLSSLDPINKTPEDLTQSLDEQNSGQFSGDENGPSPSSTTFSPLTSLQPTMWLGCQSGHLYVHSAVANWRKCLHVVKLDDSITSIVHICGRVFVSLANGIIAVFKRKSDGEWDLSRYARVEVNAGQQHSIRCLTAVPPAEAVWAAFRNQIFVIDARTLLLKHSFEGHPRRESQIRQLCWVGDGVWLSIRMDSTLHLFHAFTHQHLQDLDLEPQISSMTDTSNQSLSMMRITHLMVSGDRLWVGTSNGVIASIPFSPTQDKVPAMTSTSLSFLPIVDVNKTQLSFHGHRDAVKFFVCVPGKCSAHPNPPVPTSTSPQRRMDNLLIISGGEGYVDFRIGPNDDEDRAEWRSTTRDRSHLIVWQIPRI